MTLCGSWHLLTVPWRPQAHWEHKTVTTPDATCHFSTALESLLLTVLVFCISGEERDCLLCAVWMLKNTPCRCRMSASVSCMVPSEALSCPRDWSMTKGCHPVLWSGECPAISLWPFIQIRKPYFAKRSSMLLLCRPSDGLAQMSNCRMSKEGLNFVFNFLKTVQKPFINKLVFQSLKLGYITR